MPPNPHDLLVKGVFSDPAQLAAWLADHHPRVARHLELSSLVLAPGSFVDAQLAERHTDLLFHARLASGDDALVYVLFEHQSSVDALMPLRLLRYVVRVWDRWLVTRPTSRALPPVVPIVLYHGEAAWTAAPDVRDLVACPPESGEDLGQWLPRMSYLLHDLSALDDEELRGMALGRMAQLLLKHARTGDLGQRLPRWLDTFARAHGESGLRALELVIRYVLHVDDAPLAPAVAALLAGRLGAETVGEALGYADRMHEEGLQQGLQQGLRQGREMLLKLMERRFGAVPPEAVARVRAADWDALDAWTDRLLAAPSLDQLLEG